MPNEEEFGVARLLLQYSPLCQQGIEPLEDDPKDKKSEGEFVDQIDFWLQCQNICE